MIDTVEHSIGHDDDDGADNDDDGGGDGSGGCGDGGDDGDGGGGDADDGERFRHFWCRIWLQAESAVNIGYSLCCNCGESSRPKQLVVHLLVTEMVH